MAREWFRGRGGRKRINIETEMAGLEPSQGSTVGPGGEDLITLEAEISELQRENARVESQMMRLRTDISAMEAHLRQGDKVSFCTQDEKSMVMRITDRFPSRNPLQ